MKKRLCNKFCPAKDSKLKSDLHKEIKKYHNLILTLSRKSKDSEVWKYGMEKVNWLGQNHEKDCNLKTYTLDTNNLKIASEFNSFLIELQQRLMKE